MKILAVDPGFGRCGVAVVSDDTGKPVIHFSCCIETNKEQSFSERLRIVVDGVCEQIKQHKPDVFVIEGLFFSNNQKTALQVSEVRGALLYVVQKEGIPIYEVHPGGAKVALTGFGKATKDQVIYMVKKILALPDEQKLDDEYDALALALTGLAEYAIKKRTREL